MTDIFAMATKKAATLPRALREDIGYELIDRVAAWNELQRKIAEGLAAIDAGRVGPPPTVAEIMKEVRKRHAKRN